jgi:hypothetical protein
VSEAEDPERLLAEALRLQAARTPIPETRDVEEPTARSGLGGYGLLSGSDLGLSSPASPPQGTTMGIAPSAAATSRIEPARRVSVGWILLLAVVLGLATGAVVGLLTLL